VALDHKRRINFSELMRSGCSGAAGSRGRSSATSPECAPFIASCTAPSVLLNFGVLVLGRIAELLAAFAFALHAWPRARLYSSLRAPSDNRS